jgi:hypothetical protein
LLNDADLTPGARNPKADSALICKGAYTSLPGVRHVTDAVKRPVYALHGVEHSGRRPRRRHAAKWIT